MLLNFQTELSATRVKLIEKDREVEKMDTQLKSYARQSNGGLKRGNSQDEDLVKKMEVVEKEAK